MSEKWRKDIKLGATEKERDMAVQAGIDIKDHKMILDNPDGYRRLLGPNYLEIFKGWRASRRTRKLDQQSPQLDHESHQSSEASLPDSDDLRSDSHPLDSVQPPAHNAQPQ